MGSLWMTANAFGVHQCTVTKTFTSVCEVVNEILEVQLYNPFHATGLFRHLLKTSENLEFSKETSGIKTFRGIKRDQWHEMG